MENRHANASNPFLAPWDVMFFQKVDSVTMYQKQLWYDKLHWMLSVQAQVLIIMDGLSCLSPFIIKPVAGGQS